MWQDEHVRVFTVANAMSEDIRATVDKAIADGITLEDFCDHLAPTLRAKGRWSKSLANNSKLSDYPTECEVLFLADTKLRITDA